MPTFPLPLYAPSTGATSSKVATTPLQIANRLVLTWIGLRTLGWSLLMAARPNPPLDLIEWLSWGRHWRLGYHKHPPLAAWVAEAGWALTPGSFFGIYLLGYLAVALALWSVWDLARRVLPLRAALAATLCLEALVYLGPVSGEFNNQVLLVGFWAMLIGRAYAAWEGDATRDWVLAGVALGLALLCKYSVAFLVAPLLGWWFWREGTRRFSRLLLLAGVAGLIFLPHLVWLCRNDFITLKYASQRAHAESNGASALASQLTFVLSQVVRLTPVLLVLVPVLWKRREDLTPQPPLPRGEGEQEVNGTASRLPLVRSCSPLSPRERGAGGVRSYLLAAVVGPVVLHLLAGLVPGVKLRDLWGMPLWTFAPVALLLLWLGAEPTRRAWRRFRLLWLVVVFGVVGVTAVVQILGWPPRRVPRRVTFPGHELAAEVVGRYRSRFGVPPAVAAGDWWLAGNVCCLAPSRPMLYSSREPAGAGYDPRRDRGDPRRFAWPEPETAPWTDDGDFRRRGGVLLWDVTMYGEGMPDWLQARYPDAEPQPALALPWPGGGECRVCVGWAMMAPTPHTH